MGRVVALLLALFTWTGLALSGSNPDYLSAQRKIEQISQEQIPPGETVRLSPAEVTAYVRGQAEAEVADGLREIEVRLGNGAITWSALVNFAKLPQTEGLGSNWLLGMVLRGEKPVTVLARLASGDGRATIEVDSVEISGAAFEGGTLDFLVDQLVKTIDPDIKVGEPFELEHNVEKIAIRPDEVAVKIAD